MDEALHWIVAFVLCIFAVAMGAAHKEKDQDDGYMTIGIVLALIACALMRYA